MDRELLMKTHYTSAAEYFTRLQFSWRLFLAQKLRPTFSPLSSYLSDIHSVPGAWPLKCWATDTPNILVQTANRQSLCVALASTRGHKCVVTECLMWSQWMHSVQTQSIWAFSGHQSQRGFSEGAVWEVRPIQGWEQGHGLFDEWHYHNELIRARGSKCLFMLLCAPSLSLCIQVRDESVDLLVSLFLDVRLTSRGIFAHQFIPCVCEWARYGWIVACLLAAPVCTTYAIDRE